MPEVTVIMPVYNVARFVREAVRSVLAQSFADFELLVVDDCSPDDSVTLCRAFGDSRVRIIHHDRNRGLAAARNTGIRHAAGRFIALLDADDLWHPLKLERHVAHLRQRGTVGLSFSRSAFIEEDGTPNRCFQMPRLRDITAGHLACRNPVGNGSAPVIRREVFEAIAHDGARDDGAPCYFDESLRRSEDIECWIRIALTTHWLLEGLAEPLTYYRLNAGGLSANLVKQLESWEQVLQRTRAYAPDFVARWESLARAYQLRYLARQAIRLRDGVVAVAYCRRALRANPRIALAEPGRTLSTLVAAYLLRLSNRRLYTALEGAGRTVIGALQRGRMAVGPAARWR